MTATGAVPPMTYRIIRPDGLVRHVRGQGGPTLDPQTGATRIIGTVADVSDSLESSAKLEGALTLLRETVALWRSYFRR